MLFFAEGFTFRNFLADAFASVELAGCFSPRRAAARRRLQRCRRDREA
jgi:hypothetical protein